MGFHATELLPVLEDMPRLHRQPKTDLPLKNRVMGSRRSPSTRARFPASEPVETHWETSDTSTITVSGLACWLSRDPIAERGGLNIFCFVSNSPINVIDPLGLWGDHGVITEQSFNALTLSTTDKCKERMLDRIVDANEGQDSIWGALWENKRHFNRASDEARVAARQTYNDYIKEEKEAFDNAVTGETKAKCKEALDALGRLSHSWQDFFAHAYHETHGWNAWQNGGGGTPDNPGALYPSSYPGEHPTWSEPIAPGHTDYDARRQATDTYIQGRLSAYLGTWLNNAKCKCFCETSWWF